MLVSYIAGFHGFPNAKKTREKALSHDGERLAETAQALRPNEKRSLQNIHQMCQTVVGNLRTILDLNTSRFSQGAHVKGKPRGPPRSKEIARDCLGVL